MPNAGEHRQQELVERILSNRAGQDAAKLRRERRAFIRAVANLYATEEAANE